MPLRLDDVPPGVAFAADSGPACPTRSAPTSPTSTPARPAGEIHYRRLGADPGPSCRRSSGPAKPPGAAQLVARLPDSLAPGTYVFRADAVDAAGNARLDDAARRRHGDGAAQGAAPAPSEQPAVRAGEDADLRPAALAPPPRHGASPCPSAPPPPSAGASLDADGAGLAGRRLRVVSRPSRGALAPTAVATVETGPHGGFRLDLPAGPSRRIAVAFAGEERLEPADRAPLSLRVRGGVVFHAAPVALRTGQVVRLWGRVSAHGAPLPRRGKLVAIQYLEAATGRWRPVLVTRSDHAGRFHARYRFRYVSGPARIRLRAVALPEERWPYAPGASRPLTVRVTG